MSDKAYEQARPFQEDGHLAVPDQAEVLIDPNDPAVRDRLERALCSWFTWERVQEVKANGGLERMLAALVGKP